jgi:hypothetical protein
MQVGNEVMQPLSTGCCVCNWLQNRNRRSETKSGLVNVRGATCHNPSEVYVTKFDDKVLIVT